MFSVSQRHAVNKILGSGETVAHLDCFHDLEKTSCGRLQWRERWGRLHYELQDGYEYCGARGLDEKALQVECSTE